MSGPPRKDTDFELTGGALCLDFANTLGDRPRSVSEHLASYADLLRFSRQCESLSPAELDQLERLYDECDRCVEPIFAKVIELREALYRIFSALVRSEVADAGDLGLLNTVLRKALRQLEIRPESDGYGWAWGGPDQALDRPLWPIVRSAAELMTSEDLGSLRECDSETCSWLFLDRSRNQRRRWCDMSTCGNRAKARRHYRRRQKARV
jgi:predicted RNA-binding Zn ribbon-like protein